MKKTIVSLVVWAGILLGQNSSIPFSVSQPPAASITGVSYSNYTNPGAGNTFYYWLATNYVSGTTISTFSQIIENVNVSDPSVAHPITISFNPVQGASSYSVIRTTSSSFPSVPCTCLVGTTIGAATFINDSGVALGSFSPSIVAPATGSIRLNNSLYIPPSFEYEVNGVVTQFGSTTNVSGKPICTATLQTNCLANLDNVKTLNLLTDSLAISIGSNAPVVDDSAIKVHRVATNPIASAGSHAFQDQSLYNPGALAGGYSSLDCLYTYTGTAVLNNHAHCLQDRIQYNSTSNISEIAGFTSQPSNVGTGVVSARYGIRVLDAGGTGPITTQVALQVDNLTRGTNNYVVYSGGSAPSYFGGTIQGGGLIQGVTAKFTGLGATYGSLLSHDASGGILDNPNLTIVNGTLTMANTTNSKILSSYATVALQLESTNGNVLINPVGATVSTFSSTGLAMAAGKNITIPNIQSGTGQRFVCVTTTGALVSSATACVGT